MACADCSAFYAETCGNQGCQLGLAADRARTVVGRELARVLGADRKAPPLEPGEVRIVDATGAVHAHHVPDDFAPQIARLDLQEGDIVTVRTRSKLDPAKAERWHASLEKLIRAQGWRDVGVIILDDCTDLSIERPARAPTRMAHQRHDAPQAMGG